MTIEIYVFSSRFPPLLALWLETFVLYIFEMNLKHLIEELFEHRNTNSFELSVRLFYLGKTNKDIRVQFNVKQSSIPKLQSHP